MILRQFERIVNRAILLFLAIVVALATVEIYVLLARRIVAVFRDVEGAPAFQEVLRNAFGAVLMVILGLELMETVKAFSEEHKVRLEILFVVALIAMCRHAIQMDIEHLDGMQLIGYGVLVSGLAGGYWLVRSPRAPRPAASD
ncbi:MAG TPA: phosphate-starvation-inducible PsiE family protein [Candidatus Polarisedimenticolia bacterium]|nr:phosphate-starvation-inducible PsiE family protein [Candidatus Polarisedimenticolia bacterium]